MLPGNSSATSLRATRCVHSRTWRRLLRYRASQPFSLVSSSGEANTPPALLTRMRTGPNSSTVCASAASTCSASRTSVTMPSAPSDTAASAQLSWLRSQIATEAPNAARPAAIPRPMPLPPPVTTATCPVSRMSEGLIAMTIDATGSTGDEARCNAPVTGAPEPASAGRLTTSADPGFGTDHAVLGKSGDFLVGEPQLRQ